MDKPEEFIKTVILNLRAAKINLKTNNLISLANLRKGIRNYFGYTTEESVTKMCKLLCERGFLEVTIYGFKFTERSIGILGRDKGK